MNSPNFWVIGYGWQLQSIRMCLSYVYVHLSNEKTLKYLSCNSWHIKIEYQCNHLEEEIFLFTSWCEIWWKSKFGRHRMSIVNTNQDKSRRSVGRKPCDYNINLDDVLEIWRSQNVRIQYEVIDYSKHHVSGIIDWQIFSKLQVWRESMVDISMFEFIHANWSCGDLISWSYVVKCWYENAI